jgi:hypothetical protein
MEEPEATNPPAGLLESFLASRQQRAGAAGKPGALATDRLAYEVAYDLALIGVSAAMDIDTTPTNFKNPLRERERLEHQLADLGPNWKRFIYPAEVPNDGGIVVPT